MAGIVHYIAFIVFPLGMAFGAASDLLTMTIPNRLVLALAAAFLVLAPFAGMDLTTFGYHIAAAALVLAAAFACFAFGWIGGGDAKLAAVIALWIGWSNALDFLVLAALLGGALTMAVLSYRAAVLPGFIVRQPWLARLHDRKAGVPYGIALAAAALVIYPGTIWMTIAGG
jgi:prepilin peptidase CpaA